LGIDTPELQEQQAYAQEAKKFTNDIVTKMKSIWIYMELTSMGDS
jgi:endonuclease YncB( thermonuclease family)